MLLVFVLPLKRFLAHYEFFPAHDTQTSVALVWSSDQTPMLLGFVLPFNQSGNFELVSPFQSVRQTLCLCAHYNQSGKLCACAPISINQATLSFCLFFIHLFHIIHWLPYSFVHIIHYVHYLLCALFICVHYIFCALFIYAQGSMGLSLQLIKVC